MGFYDSYKAVFDAVKLALTYVAAVPAQNNLPEIPAHGVESIKTVILGEQFSYGALPKAIINAEPAPITPSEMGSMLNISVFFNVVLVVQEYEPKDWFVDVIKPMGDVVDAILVDRTLDHVVRDVVPVGFAPGEIKFKDNKMLFGGIVRFQAVLWL
jgi:hypothetical protein